MNKDKIVQLCENLNIKITEEQVNSILKEYENSYKPQSVIQMEILEKLKSLLSPNSISNNRLNELIEFQVGKTSLNFLISRDILDYKIRKISNELKNKKLIYETFYSYLKNTFINALVKSVPLVVENENVNKIAINDTFIKDNMPLFDELGFIIKVLTDDELDMLFPLKTTQEKEVLRYYAYITKDKFLGIFG